jgi:hypothetical protein
MNTANSDPTLIAATALFELFHELGLTGVLIGGVAVSLVARERYTKDLDAMVVFDTADAQQLLDAAHSHGFEPRFTGMIELAKQSRMVTFTHVRTGTIVDIALGAMPFEVELIRRSQVHTHGEFSVRLPTPEDLVILKGIAHRPTDILDIRTIVEIHPELDAGYIENWLRQYADLMEWPEIWDDVARILEDSNE